MRSRFPLVFFGIGLVTTPRVGRHTTAIAIADKEQSP
jgi:hypothetical protein